MMAIFIEPHERYEAIEAYRNRLTQEQIDEIEDAEDTAIIQIKIDHTGTQVVIIPEG